MRYALKGFFGAFGSFLAFFLPVEGASGLRLLLTEGELDSTRLAVAALTRTGDNAAVGTLEGITFFACFVGVLALAGTAS